MPDMPGAQQEIGNPEGPQLGNLLDAFSPPSMKLPDQAYGHTVRHDQNDWPENPGSQLGVLSWLAWPLAGHVAHKFSMTFLDLCRLWCVDSKQDFCPVIFWRVAKKFEDVGD